MLCTRSSLTALLALALCCALAAGCSDDDNGKKDTGTTPKDGGADKGGKTCTAKDLLPADNTVGDFKQQATPQTAADSKSLTDLINGGSDKYFNNRFACLALVVYGSVAKSWDLEVWLFDQTDSVGADGAYKATAISGVDADITPTIGDASRENVNTVAGVYTGYARKGKYLARIFAENKPDATAGKDDVQAMLKAIVAAIK